MSTATIRSGDTDIFCETLGDGPTLVLLHPFPVQHEMWYPVADFLKDRYRLLLPDLRGHGRSGAGNGPATMEKHVEDLVRICNGYGVAKAVFAGVSISGYILMELWRRHRERISALIFCNTRAQADSEESRAKRIKSADSVRSSGPAAFLDGMIPNLLGPTTRRNRPDIVQSARELMNAMTAEGIAALQLGMAARPDSVATLKTIDVPVLLMAGEEDSFTPAAEMERMRDDIRSSSLVVAPKAGHYAIWEQPEFCGRAIRRFLDQQR